MAVNLDNYKKQRSDAMREGYRALTTAFLPKDRALLEKMVSELVRDKEEVCIVQDKKSGNRPEIWRRGLKRTSARLQDLVKRKVDAGPKGQKYGDAL